MNSTAQSGTSSTLAIEGGTAVRDRLLPYGRQTIDESDIAAVTEVLHSDWLTTGPMIAEFEADFARAVGAEHAVAVCNGTAALHAATSALGIQPGDEVIVPSMTFAASANCVVFQGATPVFCDVEADTLLIAADKLEPLVTARTRAVIAVDYAGHPCDYPALRELADRHQLALIDDACHALGGSLRGRPVGTLADLNTFSLHPVKHLTTGEGGVITTNDPRLATRMRRFRNHGITSDHRQREKTGSWFYEMVELGYNYRLTDFQAALGRSQLKRLPDWITRRREIARYYDDAFAELPAVDPLTRRAEVEHGYHLYVIKLDLDRLNVDRGQVFRALRAEGIGVNVHYIPVHLHPYYRERFGTRPGLCPEAERAYERILSLPIFPTMTDQDAQDVVHAVRKVTAAYLA